MTRNPVGWFEIYVQDMPRAQAFYESVLQVSLEKLGLPAESDLEMMSLPMEMERPGASGSLVKISGSPSGGNSTLVYFSCEDCATEGGRVNGAGGKVQREKMSVGEYGHIVLAHDTEGTCSGCTR